MPDLWLILLAFLVLLLVVRLLLVVVPRRRRSRKRDASHRVIRVIGVGGAGGNAIDTMVRARLGGAELIACNTDAQALRGAAAPWKIRFGDSVTQGLGSGGDPETGRQAAEADVDALAAAVAGADLVFITAGLGGGTGSGAAPIVARLAREAGALTIGVVTKPFRFEGPARARIAEEAERELLGNVDALIAVPNDRVIGTIPGELPLVDAFRAADDVLHQAVRGIVDLVGTRGLVNIDFADVRSVLGGGGHVLIGTGADSGGDRAAEAARAAISSPLIEHAIDGARSILVSIVASSSLRMAEAVRVAEIVRASADPDADLVFGATIDDERLDELAVLVLAAKLEPGREPVPAVSPVRRRVVARAD